MRCKFCGADGRHFDSCLFGFLEKSAMKTLFDHASRIDDPVTSQIAEVEITAAGKRAKACRVALELVTLHPGFTSNELEASIGVQDGRIRKRLNDLLKDGLVRKGPERLSRVTGKLNETWYRSDA